ncbi:MAG: hypothetical protein ACK4SF_05340 [Algoriphagus aquaeductus]|jgi:hypothetical protein|uniref:Uncharacterized protein n=1 Tax=Algoriphagus aquaeductus TaxID=475299 RepID=A0A326RS05_9BACT|nr:MULTISPECIES: hypothetical protein [Algoriphagus]PZV84472.1 hypothetical protein CLV31_104121 [Algoriphagus aquaeductus]
MRELIKESIVDLKRADGFIYVTAEGKKIDLHEAAARGIAVTPVNPKDEVIKKLEAAGLHLTDSKFLSDLNDLISALSGSASSSKSSGKRRSFSDSEKSKIVEEWKKVEAAGKKTKAAFAREIGVGYQTFINWLRG